MQAATPPGELRPHLGQLSNPGDTPSTPSALASTPGATSAAIRHPGAPTLPEFDPVSLTLLISRMANELYSAPPDAPPVGSDEGTSQVGSTGLSPFLAPLPSSEVPSIQGYPAGTLPASVSPSPGTAPAGGVPGALGPSGGSTSPFGLPLNFDAIDLADPFGQGLGSFTTPLVGRIGRIDAPPGVPDRGLAPHAQPAPVRAPGPRPAPVFSPGAYPITPVTDLSLRSFAGAPLDPHALKRQFPILAETINGRPLVWLDNAATTQKPRAVIDRLSYFYEHENSNIHRAAHTLAARATEAYETARESVRRFLNAPSTREIVFVRGATEGINLVAKSWGARHLEAGDEIVITWLEHHANIVPWQQLASAKGARLRVAPVDDRGQIVLEEYEKLFGPRTRLVAFTQVSNALGTVTPVREMVEIAHRYGAKVLVDGAQAVSHKRVDVQAIDCDFYTFSGHKVFAPTGIGVVFGRRELLEAMPPWQGGGNMIQDVTFERTLYQGAPAKFEAGTGNIADAVGLGAALDWLSGVGLEAVEAYEHELLVYATEKLATVPGLTVIGTAPDKAGVLSFVLAGQKTEEVGGMLDRDGIAVRSGHHCAQPILRRFGQESSVRASLAPYNTREDIDTLVTALERLQAGRATRR
jgi:cysteine desulfurase/selenocysteine lyase